MKPTIVTELEFITPKRANTYLNDNTNNFRPLNNNKVTNLIKVLERGDWQTTHQGVAFDINGELNDGQHRLWAISLFGDKNPDFKGVYMNVSRGLDLKAQMVIDQHAPRLPHHVLSRMGIHTVTSKHVAITRAMAGGLQGRNSMLRDISELNRFYNTHVSAIEFAYNSLPKSAKGISCAGVKAVIARAFYHLPEQTLTRFCNVLSTGFMESGEEAAIVLRNHLISMGTSYHTGSDAMMQLIYARTERALDAFSKRRALTVTPRPISEELYLLPEEATKKKIKINTAAVIKPKREIKILKKAAKI
jgi:hypothetical protein